MNEIEIALTQDPSLVFATIIENNPAAVSSNLNRLGLYNGQASESEIKSIIDNLYNTKQFTKLRSALNVTYNFGVLPIEFDLAFTNVRKNANIKKSGNGEVIANYTPLIDDVLDFVCQMLGNCQQQQNGGNGQPMPPAPFNWTPVWIGVGILAAAGILITLIVVVGRKK
jgi:hypothetical protein